MISSKSSTLKNPKKNVEQSTTKKKATKAVRIQYVLPLGNGWVVKNSLASKFTLITDTKREAITVARSIGKPKDAKLMVYWRNGLLEIAESYLQKAKNPKRKTSWS